MAKRKKSQAITQAITHIPLAATNANKFDTLNDVAEGYQTLCQVYVIYFCEATEPDKYAKPHIVSELSQRWQRVAMQQAAGMAQQSR